MVYSKLSFGIINEHLFAPFMCRIFQTVKSLNILSLMSILDAMHITQPNNSSLYQNLHSFIIKEYYLLKVLHKDESIKCRMKIHHLNTFTHKNSIKKTPDCVQNSIYPLEVFKYDSIEPNILNKSQNLLLKDLIENALSTVYYPFHIR